MVVHARMKSSQPLVYSVEDELEAYKHASARFTDRWHRDAPFLFNTGDFVEGENLPTTSQLLLSEDSLFEHGKQATAIRSMLADRAKASFESSTGRQVDVE